MQAYLRRVVYIQAVGAPGVQGLLVGRGVHLLSFTCSAYAAPQLA